MGEEHPLMQALVEVEWLQVQTNVCTVLFCTYMLQTDSWCERGGIRCVIDKSSPERCSC